MHVFLQSIEAQIRTVELSAGGPFWVHAHDLLSHWVAALVVFTSCTAMLLIARWRYRVALALPLFLGLLLAVFALALVGYQQTYDGLRVNRAGLPLYVLNWQWTRTPTWLDGLLPLNLLTNMMVFTVIVVLVQRWARVISRADARA